MRPLSAAIAVAGLSAALGYRAHRTRRAIRVDMERLTATGLAASLEDVDSSSMQELPAPVAQYLRGAVGRDMRRIRVARLRQRGRLRTDARSRWWMSFSAMQVVAPPASAFIWDAAVGIPGAPAVRVVDSLLGGQGSGRVWLLSAFPLARSQGGQEMNSGALHRYLAEAVWYPTALLPGPNLRWQPVDGRTAVATLSTDFATVSLEFRFNERAEVTGIYAPGRWCSVNGSFTQRPWEGRFDDYRLIDGFRVPGRGEVGWHLEGRWRAVWQGALVKAEYW